MKIYWSHGKPYVERGSQLVELTPNEIKELYESHTPIENQEDDFID